MLRLIVKNIFGIFLLFGLLYGVTMYGNDVKDMVMRYIPGSAKVMGASIRNEDIIISELKSDAKTQIETLKDQSMEMKVSDVMTFFTRIRKVYDDAQGAKEYGVNKIKEVSETILPKK